MEKFIVRINKSNSAELNCPTLSKTPSKCEVIDYDQIRREKFEKWEKKENNKALEVSHNLNSLCDTDLPSKNILENNKVPVKFKDWKKTYIWLNLNKDMKAICSICCEAENKKLILNKSPQALASLEAFVSHGFSTWKNANSCFKKHESGELHMLSITALDNLLNLKPVHQSLSSAKENQMIKSRIALNTIFDSVSVLAEGGLSLRSDGNNDDHSNLMRLLRRRAKDVHDLQWWLNDNTQRKWLSHDIINEMLELISNEVLKMLISDINKAECVGIMLDEAVDSSKKEQVSFNTRIVLDNFREFFRILRNSRYYCRNTCKNSERYFFKI